MFLEETISPVRGMIPSADLGLGDLKQSIKSGVLVDAHAGIDPSTLVEFSPDKQSIKLEDFSSPEALQVMREKDITVGPRAGLDTMDIAFKNVGVHITAGKLDKRIKYLQSEFKNVQNEMAQLRTLEVESDEEYAQAVRYADSLVKRADTLGVELNKRAGEQDLLAAGIVAGGKRIRTSGFQLAPVTSTEVIPGSSYSYTIRNVPDPYDVNLRRGRGRVSPGSVRPLSPTAGRSRDYPKPRPSHRTITVTTPTTYRQREGIIHVGDPRQLKEGEHVVYSPYLTSGSVLVRRDPEKAITQVGPVDKKQTIYGGILAGEEDEVEDVMYSSVMVVGFLAMLFMLGQMRKRGMAFFKVG